jgi:hypothetical protein
MSVHYRMLDLLLISLVIQYMKSGTHVKINSLIFYFKTFHKKKYNLLQKPHFVLIALGFLHSRELYAMNWSSSSFACNFSYQNVINIVFSYHQFSLFFVFL